MKKSEINHLAKAHAISVLGEQAKTNKDAVRSIATDFKAGFDAAMQIETKYRRDTDNEDINPVDEWDSFWKQICTNPDGSLNLDQIQKELSDFSRLLRDVPKVYNVVTGGVLSKAQYPAATVIELHNNYMKDEVEDRMKEYNEENEVNKKAEKWDALGAKLENMYYTEEGAERETEDDSTDLTAVGEAAAIAYGYL